jgi:hypothetical protein
MGPPEAAQGRLTSSVVSYLSRKGLFLNSFLITHAGYIAVFSEAALISQENRHKKAPPFEGEAWLYLACYTTDGIRQ